MANKLLRQLLFLSESVGFGRERKPGGGELFAIEFLSELADRGWKISVVCPRESPLFTSQPLSDRVSFYPLDLSAKVKEPSFVVVLWKWIFLSRRFRDHIIYGNGYVTLKWLVVASILWRMQAYCHLHESSYECYHSLRARLLAPFVHRFFAISDSVRELFIKGSGVAPRKVVRVHNGVPVSDSPPGSNSDDCRVARLEVGAPSSGVLVAMVARTNELKGHEVLLRAVKPVCTIVPHVTFLIVGLEDGAPEELALYNHLQTVIDTEGIREAIRYVGFRNDARRLMRCADIVVVPSTQEGFGRTAIEAMAEGSLVIASATGGLTEIVRDGVDGWLFPAGDYNALAKRIVDMLCHPAEARVIAQRGYETARAKFSTKRMTLFIEHLLLEDQVVNPVVARRPA